MTSVDIEDIIKCIDFAEQAWNKKSQSSRNFGGIERTINQFMADQIEGKLSEVLFRNFLKEKGIDVTLDFEHYLDMMTTDDGDFNFQGLTSKVDIKGSSSRAQWLLVEDYKFNSDVFVMVCFNDRFPNNKQLRENPYILLNDFEYEGEVKGWAKQEDFFDSEYSIWFEWKQNSSPWRTEIIPNRIPYSKNRKGLEKYIERNIEYASKEGRKTTISIPLNARLNYGIPIKWLRNDWSNFMEVLQ